MAKSVITVPVRGTTVFDRFAPVISPPAPTLLAVTPGNSENNLTWSASAGAVSYVIYFQTSPGVTTGSTSIPVGNITSFVHSGLVNGTTYFYKVQAIGSGGGESALSNELSGTPTAATFLNTNSLALDGVNQHGIIPFSQTAPIRFNRNNAWGLSMWVKPEGTGNEVLWDFREGTSGAGYYVELLNNRRILVQFETNNGNQIEAETIASLSNGNWAHIVVTKSSSIANTSFTIYVDSAVQAVTRNGTNLSGSTNYSQNLLIGARGADNGTQRYFEGNIDEFSIFSKELSQANVDELYNLGVPSDVSVVTFASDLEGWWRFGDAGDTTSVSFDQTANNMDVNFINSPSYAADTP